MEEVTAYGTTSKSPIFAPYEYPTTTITLLKFADGRVGKVTSVIDCLQPYYFHSHLVGSDGTCSTTKLHPTKLPGMIKTRWSHARDAPDRLGRRERPPVPAAVPGLRRRDRGRHRRCR